MTKLPEYPNISISKLTAVFKNTSATYKFYWFWAILQAIEDGKKVIKKREIFARMITLSWYTVNYFHISFGKQDLIQSAILEIKDIESLSVDANQKTILETLLKTTNSKTLSILNHFDKNVPHKFLSPWLSSANKSKIYSLSLDDDFKAPYLLYKDSIKISNNWWAYFNRNSGILKTFCYWNLTLFLQSRNPNVPDIPNKIQRPINRGNLSKHKKKFWDLVINEIGAISCIYTGKNLNIGDYVIEHFVPYQFVAHDLMWNLIPADSSFNSKKSDKLPNFDLYFNSFFEIQKIGVDIIKSNTPQNSFLEDYLPIFPDLNVKKDKFEEHIKPMLSVAHNNGFQYLQP